MHRKSQYNIHIDLDYSRGSYLTDKKTGKTYLDFMSMFASCPLGYNHPVFNDDKFIDAVRDLSRIKIPNCEFITDVGEKFYTKFTTHPSMRSFKYFHFCCTGALAIEAAVKTAMVSKGFGDTVVSLHNSFHGINSYGNFLSDRGSSALNRLLYFPDLDWYKVSSPSTDCITSDKTMQEREDGFFNELHDLACRVKICAIVVEPIQCTIGDWMYTPRFFLKLREYCDTAGICLVFDEIQTGFGGTGTMWYFEQLGIVPDIVCFGKKSQVSGIMVKEDFGSIFNTPEKLEVTWDGDLMDMLRCTYIMQEYNNSDILTNVIERSIQFKERLFSINGIHNIRGKGLLLSFDIENRDAFIKSLFDRGMICNRAKYRTVRLRPNLAVSYDDINNAADKIEEACGRT